MIGTLGMCPTAGQRGVRRECRVSPSLVITAKTDVAPRDYFSFMKECITEKGFDEKKECERLLTPKRFLIKGMNTDGSA